MTGLFASCVATPEARWRNPEGAIASTTRFDADRFEGEWRRVAAFSASFLAPACPSIRFVREGAGLRVALCGTGRGEFYAVDPLGRLTQGSGPPLWVLWVDEGFRTAVIGTPDGSFGWILERTGSVEQDRLAAAREILAFNGYDPARMTLLR
ncbi:MAG: lipocalin family protein [Pseudomonadota bacterium]